LERKLVIIPTYNEIENIERMIRKVMSLSRGYDLLIVDDGSPDGTATKIKELQPEFPERIQLIERSGKSGLGTAYITGFKWALEHDYDFVFEMDCDFSHNPDDLDNLYDACKEGADLAIGSRYVNNLVNVVNWPMGRVLMSYFASKYVKLVTGMPIFDSTAGFICYRKEVLNTINFNRVKFVGYAFQIEMKFRTWKYGFKIKEVPVIFTDRALGQSKMNMGIFNEAVFGVLRLKFRSLFQKFERKE